MTQREQNNSVITSNAEELSLFWNLLLEEQDPISIALSDIMQANPVTFKKIEARIVGIAGISRKTELFCFILKEHEHQRLIDQMIQEIIQNGTYSQFQPLTVKILSSEVNKWVTLKKYGFNVINRFTDSKEREIIEMGLLKQLDSRIKTFGVRKRISSSYDLVLKLKAFREIRKAQWWTQKKLERVQFKKLHALIHFSYHNVKFYREKMRSVGVSPYDIQTLSDLNKIPITTKAEIRSASLSDVLATPFTLKNTIQYYTSGTTGYPLIIHNSYHAVRIDQMLRWDRYYQGGAKFRDKIYELRAYLYDQSTALKAKKWWHKLGIGRRTTISATKSPEEIFTAMQEYSPEAVFGFPSILQALGRELKKQDKYKITPKNLFTTAETLSNQNRHEIEQLWGAEVTDWYGSNEFQSVAWECTKHEGYHVNIAHLILESLKEGESVAHGERGNIIITGLYNYAMPLIRYHLGDSGIMKDDPCSCKRGLPLLEKIEGRVDDFICLPNGKLISPIIVIDVFEPKNLELPSSSIPLSEYVQKFKIIQHTKSTIEIQIVPGSRYIPEIQTKIQAQLARLTGEDMKFNFNFVKDIPKDPSGKLRIVVSHVPRSL